MFALNNSINPVFTSLTPSFPFLTEKWGESFQALDIFNLSIQSRDIYGLAIRSPSMDKACPGRLQKLLLGDL